MMLKVKIFKRIIALAALIEVSFALAKITSAKLAINEPTASGNPFPKKRVGSRLNAPLPSLRGNTLKTVKGADTTLAEKEIESLLPYSPIHMELTGGIPNNMADYISDIEHATDILLNGKIIVLQPDSVSFYLNSKLTGTTDNSGNPYHFMYPRYAFKDNMEKDDVMNTLMKKLNGEEIDPEKFTKIEHLGAIIDHERYIKYRDDFMNLLYFEIESVSDVAKVITQATKESDSSVVDENGEAVVDDMADTLTKNSEDSSTKDGALVSLEAGIYFTADELYDIRTSVISIIVSERSKLSMRMDSIKLVAEFSGPYDYLKFIIQVSKTMKSYSIEFKNNNIIEKATNRIIRLTIRAGEHANSILVDDPLPNSTLSDSSTTPLDGGKPGIFYRFANDDSADDIELGESRSFSSVLNTKDRSLIITPSSSTDNIIIGFPPLEPSTNANSEPTDGESDKLMTYNVDYFEILYILMSQDLLAGKIEASI